MADAAAAAAPWLPGVAAGALTLRAALALWPHSGRGQPPMFGDLEAQRHWAEIAINLPAGNWYVNSTANDLNYWGLDYPPATAYAAWLVGRAAQAVAPSVVAPGASRGDESPAAVALMRASALVFDALSYMPAVVAYLALAQPVWRRDPTSPRAALLREAALLLALPALVLIDHGHFQWNSLSLGLAVAAVTALARRWWLTGAAAFALALNVKQMQLYYAPALFVFLLAACARGGAGAVLPLPLLPAGWRGGSVSFASAAVAVAGVGAVVAAVFAALWAPFCVGAPLELGCAGGLAAVLRRQFPFDRSLFEDKVSNLWCAAEPALRLRARIYAAGPAEGHDIRARVAALSAGLTAAMMAPALVGLARRLWAHWKVGLAVMGDRDGDGGEAGRRGAAGRRLAQPPAAAADSDGHPAAWAPHEWLLLAMACTSLAFFLASYQVHEKGVLLPLLPVALLRHRLPLAAAWLSLAAVWSMWPLLAKDGLLAPAAVVCAAHAALGWPSASDVVAGDGAFAAAATRGRVPARVAARWLTAAAAASLAGMGGLSAAAALVPPPARLPDIHSYASAVYSAGLLTALWAGLSAGALQLAAGVHPAAAAGGDVGAGSPRRRQRAGAHED